MSFTLKDFQDVSKHFKLGTITTESFHPKSSNLSSIVKSDIADAVSILSEIDNDALDILKTKAKDIFDFQKICQDTIKENNKIFISGCGATGRLALSIEKLFRAKFNRDNVVGFMAGGDYALIKSVESFEDNIDYGHRQLKDLGFTEDDLVVGITEGGETTFVIGSTEHGAEFSKRSPYFLYCNPDEELKNIERSKRVIEDKRIKKINLATGPMGISGSTRMQATTVQMIAAGFAILYSHDSFESFLEDFESFISELKNADKAFLSKFIAREVDLYKKDGVVTYRANSDIAITILTDTTERSPTFNLAGFERAGENDELSLSYLAIEGEANTEGAWRGLLSRDPRCLEWDGLSFEISKKEALKFDISENSILRRAKSKDNHLIFSIKNTGNQISYNLGDCNHEISHRRDLFYSHMYLKLTLNIHSTLIMGLLNRFEGNMMTYVRPSNYKLIDRAQRYISELLRRDNIEVPETDIIKKIFEYQKSGSKEAVVLYVRDLILEERQNKRNEN